MSRGKIIFYRATWDRTCVKSFLHASRVNNAERSRLQHHRATMVVLSRTRPYEFYEVSGSFYGIDLFANLYVTAHRKESYDHGERERKNEARSSHIVSFNSRLPIGVLLFFFGIGYSSIPLHYAPPSDGTLRIPFETRNASYNIHLICLPRKFLPCSQTRVSYSS